MKVIQERIAIVVTDALVNENWIRGYWKIVNELNKNNEDDKIILKKIEFQHTTYSRGDNYTSIMQINLTQNKTSIK